MDSLLNCYRVDSRQGRRDGSKNLPRTFDLQRGDKGPVDDGRIL
jgi:hypothetical protein